MRLAQAAAQKQAVDAKNAKVTAKTAAQVATEKTKKAKTPASKQDATAARREAKAAGRVAVAQQKKVVVEVRKAKVATQAATSAMRVASKKKGSVYAKDRLGGIIGEETTVLTTSASCLNHEQARYRLTEVEKLKPSHDGCFFFKTPGYPEGIQERRYGKDKAEQAKVITNAAPGCFEPAILANTDPTPIGGPPISNPAGFILGGNSRAMVLQRVWRDPEGASALEYRKLLSSQAQDWGFVAADVASMARPCLVRVVGVKATLKDAVRRYNESLTQSLDVTAQQVATSARIDDVIIAELSEMGSDETLNAFLQSGRSKHFVKLLQKRNVITRQNQNAYIKAGLLNDDGRRFVGRALVGRILQDADVLDLLFQQVPSLRENLARAVPFILQASSMGPEWDLTNVMPDAARLFSAARSSGTSIEQYLQQSALFSSGVNATSASALLAKIFLEENGPIKLKNGFQAYNSAAQGGLTISLLPEPELPPVEALAKAFRIKSIPSGPDVLNVTNFAPTAVADKAKPVPIKKAEASKKAEARSNAQLADLAKNKDTALGRAAAAEIEIRKRFAAQREADERKAAGYATDPRGDATVTAADTERHFKKMAAASSARRARGEADRRLAHLSASTVQDEFSRREQATASGAAERSGRAESRQFQRQAREAAGKGTNGWIVDAKTSKQVRPATFAELVASLDAAQSPTEVGVFKDPITFRDVYVDRESSGPYDAALAQTRHAKATSGPWAAAIERLSAFGTSAVRAPAAARVGKIDGRTRRVGLVACSGSKLDKAAPASEFYTSPLFKKSRDWAKANTDEWLILSAKHGLVDPSKRLVPYDLALSSLTAADRRKWAAKVKKQLGDRYDLEGVKFIVLAGKDYRGAVAGLPHEVPMKGKGIGDQLGWLTAEAKRAAPNENMPTPEQTAGMAARTAAINADVASSNAIATAKKRWYEEFSRGHERVGARPKPWSDDQLREIAADGARATSVPLDQLVADNETVAQKTQQIWQRIGKGDAASDVLGVRSVGGKFSLALKAELEADAAEKAYHAFLRNETDKETDKRAKSPGRRRDRSVSQEIYQRAAREVARLTLPESKLTSQEVKARKAAFRAHVDQLGLTAVQHVHNLEAEVRRLLHNERIKAGVTHVSAGPKLGRSLAELAATLEPSTSIQRENTPVWDGAVDKTGHRTRPTPRFAVPTPEEKRLGLIPTRAYRPEEDPDYRHDDSLTSVQSVTVKNPDAMTQGLADRLAKDEPRLWRQLQAKAKKLTTRQLELRAKASTNLGLAAKIELLARAKVEAQRMGELAADTSRMHAKLEAKSEALFRASGAELKKQAKGAGAKAETAKAEIERRARKKTASLDPYRYLDPPEERDTKPGSDVGCSLADFPSSTYDVYAVTLRGSQKGSPKRRWRYCIKRDRRLPPVRWAIVGTHAGNRTTSPHLFFSKKDDARAFLNDPARIAEEIPRWSRVNLARVEKIEQKTAAQLYAKSSAFMAEQRKREHASVKVEDAAWRTELVAKGIVPPYDGVVFDPEVGPSPEQRMTEMRRRQTLIKGWDAERAEAAQLGLEYTKSEAEHCLEHDYISVKCRALLSGKRKPRVDGPARKLEPTTTKTIGPAEINFRAALDQTLQTIASSSRTGAEATKKILALGLTPAQMLAWAKRLNITDWLVQNRKGPRTMTAGRMALFLRRYDNDGQTRAETAAIYKRDPSKLHGLDFLRAKAAAEKPFTIQMPPVTHDGDASGYGAADVERQMKREFAALATPALLALTRVITSPRGYGLLPVSVVIKTATAEYKTRPDRSEKIVYKAPSKLSVGDILVSSLSYEETYVTFYEVTKTTPKQVYIREIKDKRVVRRVVGTQYVVPVLDTGLAKYRGKAERKKVQTYDGRLFVDVGSSSAYQWHGEPVSESYMGYLDPEWPDGIKPVLPEGEAKRADERRTAARAERKVDRASAKLQLLPDDDVMGLMGLLAEPGKVVMSAADADASLEAAKAAAAQRDDAFFHAEAKAPAGAPTLNQALNQLGYTTVDSADVGGRGALQGEKAILRADGSEAFRGRAAATWTWLKKTGQVSLVGRTVVKKARPTALGGISSAGWEATGKITGGKYKYLVERGRDVKWKDEVLSSDVLDPDRGVGPLTLGQANALTDAGLVVVLRKVTTPIKVDSTSVDLMITPILTIRIDGKDLDYETARRAHQGTSHSPEKRARGEQDQYVNQLKDVYNRYIGLATTPEKQTILFDELNAYKAGYLRHATAMLQAKSRVISVLVTGPANFPTRRNNKANAAADQKTQAFLEWDKKARKAIRKALTPELQPIVSGQSDTRKRLEVKLEKLKTLQTLMKGANKLIRPFKNQKATRDVTVARLRKLGLGASTAKQLLEPDFAGRFGFPAYELTNNNANIKRLEGRIKEDVARKKAEAAPGAPTGYKFRDGGEVSFDVDDNRIRIHFPGKPDAKARATLKRYGFKWSPTNTAWQRQLTDNAKRATRSVLQELGLELPTDPDLALQHEAPPKVLAGIIQTRVNLSQAEVVRALSDVNLYGSQKGTNAAWRNLIRVEKERREAKKAATVAKDWIVKRIEESGTSDMLVVGKNLSDGGKPFYWHLRGKDLGGDHQRFDFSNIEFIDPKLRKTLEYHGIPAEVSKVTPLFQEARGPGEAPAGHPTISQMKAAQKDLEALQAAAKVSNILQFPGVKAEVHEPRGAGAWRDLKTDYAGVTKLGKDVKPGDTLYNASTGRVTPPFVFAETFIENAVTGRRGKDYGGSEVKIFDFTEYQIATIGPHGPLGGKGPRQVFVVNEPSELVTTDVEGVQQRAMAKRGLKIGLLKSGEITHTPNVAQVRRWQDKEIAKFKAAVFAELARNGWDVEADLKTPHATKGNARLWIKPTGRFFLQTRQKRKGTMPGQPAKLDAWKLGWASSLPIGEPGKKQFVWEFDVPKLVAGKLNVVKGATQTQPTAVKRASLEAPGKVDPMAATRRAVAASKTRMHEQNAKIKATTMSRAQLGNAAATDTIIGRAAKAELTLRNQKLEQDAAPSVADKRSAQDRIDAGLPYIEDRSCTSLNPREDELKYQVDITFEGKKTRWCRFNKKENPVRWALIVTDSEPLSVPTSAGNVEVIPGPHRYPYSWYSTKKAAEAALKHVTDTINYRRDTHGKTPDTRSNPRLRSVKRFAGSLISGKGKGETLSKGDLKVRRDRIAHQQKPLEAGRPRYLFPGEGDSDEDRKIRAFFKEATDASAAYDAETSRLNDAPAEHFIEGKHCALSVKNAATAPFHDREHPLFEARLTRYYVDVTYRGITRRFCRDTNPDTISFAGQISKADKNIGAIRWVLVGTTNVSSNYYAERKIEKPWPVFRKPSDFMPQGERPRFREPIIWAHTKAEAERELKKYTGSAYQNLKIVSAKSYAPTAAQKNYLELEAMSQREQADMGRKLRAGAKKEEKASARARRSTDRERQREATLATARVKKQTTRREKIAKLRTAGKLPTYAAQLQAILDELDQEGWAISTRTLATPHATKANVRLYFKPRSIYLAKGLTLPSGVALHRSFKFGDARSLHFVDLRTQTAKQIALELEGEIHGS